MLSPFEHAHLCENDTEMWFEKDIRPDINIIEWEIS